MICDSVAGGGLLQSFRAINAMSEARVKSKANGNGRVPKMVTMAPQVISPNAQTISPLPPTSTPDKEVCFAWITRVLWCSVAVGLPLVIVPMVMSRGVATVHPCYSCYLGHVWHGAQGIEQTVRCDV